MHRSTLRTAALAAVSALTLGGAFALTSSPAVQDGSDKGQTAQDAKKKEQSTPPVGRGRRSGTGDAPKPVSVPRSKPTARRAPDDEAQAKEAELRKAKGLDDGESRKLEQQAKGGRRGAAPTPPRNPNAKLEIEFGKDVHDFGNARQGDLLTHAFQMKSAGTEPLVITQASPTCGCTLGEVRVLPEGATTPELYTLGNPIPPNADVMIEATLDTASKRNDTQVRIQVYSNDGKTPVQSLTLKAHIEPFIIASPPYVQLGQIREGNEKVAKVTFRTSGGERVLLTENVARGANLPAGLSYELAPINADEEGKSNQWQATFTVGADAAEGPGGYLLRLNTDIPLPKNEKKEQQAKIAGEELPPAFYSCDANISYSIIGALAIQPMYLSMGLVRPGQPLVRSARLTSYEPDFDLSKVKATLEGQNGQPLAWADSFEVSVKPVSGSNAVDLEVRLDGLPEDADGAFRGTIKVQTGHPAKPEMEVRFSGVCRKLGATARPGSGADAEKAARLKREAAEKAKRVKEEAEKKAAGGK